MMRLARQWCLLLAAVMATALPSHAQDAPVLRVAAKAPAKGQSGATIELHLEVMTTTWFTHPPELPKLDLPGVMVTPPSGHGELVRYERDGVALNGLRYTYLLSAESAGAIQIPALSVSAQLGPGGVRATAESAPLSIEITGESGPAKVVGDLTVTQSFELAPDPMVQGGRITRSVTQRADGVQPMLLPPAPLEDVPHFKRYPREPDVVTLTDGRGGFLGGQRIDRADYVAEEAGRFALPPLTLHWTDGGSGAPRSQTLPGREVDIGAAPKAAPPFSLQEDLAKLRHGVRWALPAWVIPTLVGMALTLLILWLGRTWWMRFGRFVAAAARRGKARWLASESHYWWAWRRESRAAAPVLSAFYRWMRRISGEVALRPAMASMEEQDRQLAKTALHHLYETGDHKADWRARLAARSRVWRKAWRSQTLATSALPEKLNSVNQRRVLRKGRS